MPAARNVRCEFERKSDPGSRAPARARRIQRVLREALHERHHALDGADHVDLGVVVEEHGAAHDEEHDDEGLDDLEAREQLVLLAHVDGVQQLEHLRVIGPVLDLVLQMLVDGEEAERDVVLG